MNVWSFAVSGTNFFADTWVGGMYLSTDNGTSWTAMNNVLPGNETIKSLVVSGMNIYTGTYHGVYLSTNNGVSWAPINNGLTTLHVMSLAISGNNIFAVTEGSKIWKRPIF